MASKDRKQAQVTLLTSLSLRCRGHLFEKGKPLLITKEADVDYFRSNSNFVVTDMKGEDAKPADESASTETGKKATGAITSESLKDAGKKK